MVITCLTLNCERGCTVSDTVTAADIADNRWCECLYHDPKVVLELQDANEDGYLYEDEFCAMFDQMTDEFIMDWPHSYQKNFDECDEDRDGLMSSAEIETCYDRVCVEDCSTAADRDARTDTWCECRTSSYDVIIEQFDENDDGSIELSEFMRIYTEDTDTININFSQATTTRAYFYTEAVNGSTDTGYCAM